MFVHPAGAALTGRPRRFRLHVEGLEPRSVPSASPFTVLAPLHEAEPNDTLDSATALGDPLAGAVDAAGSIGNGPGGPADVDWYSFTLDSPARVTLTAGAPAGSRFAAVVGLYDTDRWSFSDPDGADGYRLVTQNEGSPGTAAVVQQDLPGGTYYAAVSGAGNLDFHPFITASGVPGATGAYDLVVTAAAVATPAGGPVVLSSNPAPGASLDSSPLVLRVSLAGQLDPNTIIPDLNVGLVYSRSGGFTPDDSQPVPLAWANFNNDASELQLAPAAALQPGYYQLQLLGDGTSGLPVLADLSGTPLGADADHPDGQNAIISFRVTGTEGGAAADDTPATAHPLGDLSAAGSLRAAGAIGDDPYYDPNNPDPARTNPGADVDEHHFRISGPGLYAVTAEVFAGRIGSLLDPAVALYRLDPTDQSLHLVAANGDTQNPTTAAGQVPLYTDAAVFAGLTAGDFVVAVSGAHATFDPAVSHSGTAGGSTGRYVLSLSARPAGAPPRVAADSLRDGAALAAPPTEFTVQFSSAVDLRQLAFDASLAPTPGQINAVTVVGPDRTVYYPRLVGYDDGTNLATFLMLDRLPDGAYELRLSGSQGLTDLAGQPLVGNTPGGDSVIHFTVAAGVPAWGSDPLLRTSVPPTARTTDPQDLGVLFPNEVAAGVVVDRTAAPARPADGADYYRFQVLQDQLYSFVVSGPRLPAGTRVGLFGPAGNELPVTVTDDGTVAGAHLSPGVYVVRVGGWAPDAATGVAYQLKVSMKGSADNPPPLVIGPRPISTAGLVTIQPPSVPSPTAVPPAGTGGLQPVSGVTTPVTSGDQPAAPAPGVSPVGTTPGPPVPLATVFGPYAGQGQPGPNGVTTGPGRPAAGGEPVALPVPTKDLLAATLLLLVSPTFVPAAEEGAAPAPSTPAEPSPATAPPPSPVPAALLSGLQAGPVGGIEPRTSDASIPPLRPVAAGPASPAIAPVVAVVAEVAEPEPAQVSDAGPGARADIWWPIGLALAAVSAGVGTRLGARGRTARTTDGPVPGLLRALDCPRAGCPDQIVPGRRERR